MAYSEVRTGAKDALFRGQAQDRPMTPEQISDWIEGVSSSMKYGRKLPTRTRIDVLEKVAALINRDRASLAGLISQEVQKPIRDARREVDRAQHTFRLAAQEASRLYGEWMPLDLEAASDGRSGLVRRFPRGPCLLITPFNFPLNLVAHKVAPAMAVGASFLLKPAPQAPATALALGRLLLEAGWPAESFAVVPCETRLAEAMVRDPRFAVLSFTGSATVGWRLRAIAGEKHCILELGGNAGAIIARDADLDLAAERCAIGAYGYAGQTCISVQRILVEDTVAAEFAPRLLDRIRTLKLGAVDSEDTDLGPVIDDASGDRIEAWVNQAIKGGGQLLAGGTRRGRWIPPTLVGDPPSGSLICTEEAFGPIATLEHVPNLEGAVDRLNASRFGLQAGLFCRDIQQIWKVYEDLSMGGVVIDDVPGFRSDAMPYGGTRSSGIGREGPRYAMLELTESRVLVLRAQRGI